jgi:hypothetical protein
MYFIQYSIICSAYGGCVAVDKHASVGKFNAVESLLPSRRLLLSNRVVPIDEVGAINKADLSIRSRKSTGGSFDSTSSNLRRNYSCDGDI